MSTPAERNAAFDAVLAVTEAIRTARRIPNGHLYALCMPAMSLATYTSIIDLLKRTNLVREYAHELIWCGPELAPSKTPAETPATTPPAST